MIKAKKPFNKKKLWYTLLIVLAGILVVAGILFVLEQKQVINLFKDRPQPEDEAQTTSQTATAQADFTAGNEREAGSTNSENRGSGVVTDNRGAAASDTSKPTTSSTGEITVYVPTGNAVVTSGQEISGKSSLSKVSFRLIDDVTGVIAMGELQVVNGSFSGTLNFTTSANTGRLDIFGTRDDFSEFSNVNIPLRFK